MERRYCSVARLISLIGAVALASASGPSVCQPIYIKMCKDLPYNETRFPNLVGNDDQDEAEFSMDTFSYLITTQCSSQLKFFLCSVYAPMCTPKVKVSIGPCRPLCESVKSRCEPILSQFGFPWPFQFNCSKFPLENNAVTMCMYPEDNGAPEELASPPVNSNSKPVSVLSQDSFNLPPGPPVTCRHVNAPGKHLYINRTSTCSLECNSESIFTKRQRDTAANLCFALASLCVVLTVISLIMSLRNSVKIQYPEMPLLFVTICCGCGAVAVFVRWFSGRSATSCVEYAGVEVLVVSGLQQTRCAVVAILLYFFGIASRLWWLILCWVWFLSIVFHWSSEALALHRFYYHFVTWGISVVMVVILLVKQAVDADELTGLCFVGQQTTSRDQLVQFLIVPELILLIGGTVPFLCSLGTILICESTGKKAREQQRPPAQYWYGLLAAIYLPISSTLVGCYFYEYRDRGFWSDTVNPPSFETFLVKIMSTFLYGLCAASALIVRRCCAPCAEKFGENKTTLPIKHYPHQPISPVATLHKHKGGAGSHHYPLNMEWQKNFATDADY